MKVVIVGGVAGGASAAARLRRLDEKAEIVIFEKTGHISYANCGLPYYVGGVIESEDSLYLQTPESFYNRFRVSVKVSHEVLSIDRERKVVSVKRLSDGTVFEEGYDRLILATGARAIIPPGFDRDNVFTLKTSEDAVHIRKRIDKGGISRAAVIGGGFIGLEIAENLAARGIDVVIVERSQHVLPNFDEDMAVFVHQEIRGNGIRLLLDKGAESFDGSVLSLDSGERLNVDLVVLSIGVRPETELAKRAGLDLGVKDSIRVNDRLQTSDESIYAVGDAVEVCEIVSGRRSVMPLAGPANKMGRIVADNIASRDSRYKGSLGASILKVFKLTAASVGINESVARSTGVDYDYIIISPASHASYYPGGKIMTMKVLFEKRTGRLLGAQIVGYDGVDKRIDVLATALKCGLKADKLAELELSYAPPFSSAKDPVNMAGFVISNVLEGLVKQFSYKDIPELRKREDVILLDTRTRKEVEGGIAEGFINIPLDELRDNLERIDKDKKVYVMCQSGLRSYLATRILTQNGYDAFNFRGGYGFYSALERDEKALKEGLGTGK